LTSEDRNDAGSEMSFNRRSAFATFALVIFGQSAAAQPHNPRPWQDNFTARLEILALLETLNADLLSHDSATLTLDRWCGDHKLASPAHIVANLIERADKKPTAEQRQLLGVSSSERVRYRRVRLSCGDHVLSEADNWYVPSRLTLDMNHILDTTDTSFGRVVRPLDFHRHTLSAKLLYSPLPKNWEMGAPIPEGHETALAIPHAVLEHRAVLTLPNGTPFSQVIETYTSDVLDFDQR
jgi:chorismate-pyruvate lyase